MTLGVGKTSSFSTAHKSHVANSKIQYTPWTAEIVKKYNKLPLTRAFLLMHKTQIQGTSREGAQQNLQVKVLIVSLSFVHEFFAGL